MEGRRFDQLARSITGLGTRRGLLQGGVALSLLAGLTSAPRAEAKSCAKQCKKKNRKKARRRCRKRCRQRRRNDQAPPDCTTSADCPAGEVCEDEQCLPEPDQCAANAECDDCEACEGGACVTTCAQGEICRNGECCQPLTACPDGHDCGVMDDECGGLRRCGPADCDNGHFCFDNRCFCPDGYARCEGVCCDAGDVCNQDNGACCTPDCAGKACGVDDGCGGECQEGSCPTCHFCREGTCEQEFPGTFCSGENDVDICLFDGSCGVFTCDNNDDCPGDCTCAASAFSNLCHEGFARGCPGAESCAFDFTCPPGFECRARPGDYRCIPLCSG